MTTTTRTYRRPANAGFSVATLAQSARTASARIAARRGFTAVELVMVATVIAILTLMALPLFRRRVEETRVEGARDEMLSIAKAQILAHEEAGYYFRLNDLDNTNEYDVSGVDYPPEQVRDGVPHARWNRELTQETAGERGRMGDPDNPRAWRGPYLTYRNTVDMRTLINDFDPLMFRVQQSGTNPSNASFTGEGPVLILQSMGSYPNFWSAEDVLDGTGLDSYPVDPWGNPYLFFGADQRMIPHPNGSWPTDFEVYKTNWVVSLGPNGIPGGDEGLAIVQQSYWREGPGDPSTEATLGTGDDLVYEF